MATPGAVHPGEDLKYSYLGHGATLAMLCNRQEAHMKLEEFKTSVAQQEPPTGLSAPLVALWWDRKGEWAQAHSLVDELETKDGMAVHAYLHRKEGQAANSDYWYQRAGREHYRADLSEEWETLAAALLSSAK